MKITYIKDVKYCCKDMKELMNTYEQIYYKKGKLIFELPLPKNFLCEPALDINICYCPFCGEKVVFDKFIINK